LWERFKALEENELFEGILDEIYRCSKCGFCQASCPVYRVTGRESSTARGHRTQIKNLLEERLAPRKEVLNTLSECLLCRACTKECFPKINTDNLVVYARNNFFKKFGQPLAKKIIFENLLENPFYLSMALKFARKFNLNPASKILKKIFLRKALKEKASVADEFLRMLPDKFYAQNPRAKKARKGKGSVSYFLSCGVNFLFPEIGNATVRSLEALNLDVNPLDNLCCGLPAYASGDIKTAIKLAKRNLDIIKQAQSEVTIVDCGS
jgi:glycolate oxidase iron-sulfur subunit